MPRSFERPATIALRGADGEAGRVLDGLLVDGGGNGGAVIAPPHPLYGGSMGLPVVTEIAHACQKAGLASLRFDWRGVGASAGEISGEEAVADEDYASALDFVEETAPGPVVACGYSFGAAAAIRASRDRKRLTRLLLVAPPPSLLDAELLRAFRGEGGVWVAAGGRDALAPAAELAPLVESLPKARFVTIPESDHFFAAGLAELGRAAAEWLSQD